MNQLDARTCLLQKRLAFYTIWCTCYSLFYSTLVPPLPSQEHASIASTSMFLSAKGVSDPANPGTSSLTLATKDLSHAIDKNVSIKFASNCFVLHDKCVEMRNNCFLRQVSSKLATIALSLCNPKVLLADKRRQLNFWQESTDRKAATKIQALWRGYRQVRELTRHAPIRRRLRSKSAKSSHSYSLSVCISPV